jgi:hypothetical protein
MTREVISHAEAREGWTRSEFAGLYASPPARLPFARSLEIRAFLLRRERGNLLLYTAPTVDAESLARLGGVARQYLGHWHEAMFASDRIGAPLFCHANDRDSAEESIHVRGAFSKRHVLDGDLEVIPTPGHTAGATAYLWDSGQHRFLFTSDTVYLRDGEWAAAVLDSSDPGPYAESLALIRELDFDVLVPWAATAGGPWYAVTSQTHTGRRIDALLRRLAA